ncbi:hypothetical protein F8S13_10205 [Chloroflexia bacterium SDU3-3]|nr:hypothetical protein F8S13_10205 [Chloroflexia bacterium SDU3-3]
MARAQAPTKHMVYLPMVSVPAPRNPFGFDLSIYSSGDVLKYGLETQPRWARAGDVLWPKVEPVRGAGYDWSSLVYVESNIRRLRAAGIEPTLIIQQSPSWAQQVGGRLCSPPKPEVLDDFANYVYALVKRYSSGDLQVNYWEFWNEPDARPQDTLDEHGIGCWADPSKADYGGSYYGQVLQRISPMIKAANPNAKVIAGALIYGLVSDTSDKPHISELFLDGMLASGAGKSFDALSFHAYGEYGANSMLVAKAIRVRAQLAKYQLSDKPIYSTELAAMCAGWVEAECTPTYNDWLYTQANYAARIYAEALALKLDGAFWYSLSGTNPGFRFSHLIDDTNGRLVPRPAYYAFMNSSHLLSGAEYIGPPLTELAPDQLEKVQMLKFKKPTSTLYVLWVPRIDSARPDTIYRIPVLRGAKAYCVQTLNKADSWKTPYECTDTNSDGLINIAVNSNPFYVEVPN